MNFARGFAIASTDAYGHAGVKPGVQQYRGRFVARS
jgi:hypothetical protein